MRSEEIGIKREERKGKKEKREEEDFYHEHSGTRTYGTHTNGRKESTNACLRYDANKNE